MRAPLTALWLVVISKECAAKSMGKRLNDGVTQSADHTGRAEAAVALRLLMRAARPLLVALETWLDNGLLTNNDECFICSGVHRNSQSN